MRPPLIKTDMGWTPLFGSDRLYTTFRPGASIGIALDPDRDRETVDLVTEGREPDEARGDAARPAPLGGRERGLELGDRAAVEGEEAVEARAEGARRPHGAHRRLLRPEERHDLLDRADHVAVRGRVARRRDALEPAGVAPADGRDARQVLLPRRLGVVAAPKAEPEPHAERSGQRNRSSEHEPPAAHRG